MAKKAAMTCRAVLTRAEPMAYGASIIVTTAMATVTSMAERAPMDATYAASSKTFRFTATRTDMDALAAWMAERLNDLDSVLAKAGDTAMAKHLSGLREHYVRGFNSITAAIDAHDNPPKRVRVKKSAPKPFGQWSPAEVRAYLGREPRSYEGSQEEWGKQDQYTRSQFAEKREQFELSMRGEVAPEVQS